MRDACQNQAFSPTLIFITAGTDEDQKMSAGKFLRYRLAPYKTASYLYGPMLKRCLTLLVLPLLTASFTAREPYKIYSGTGKEVTFSQMVKELQKADVILFGELHDNTLCHWLEYETAAALQEKLGSRLILGAEMLERDNQLQVDEYLKGMYNEDKFEQDARVWPNHKTDYRPLLELARDKNLRFIASNVPRRYASVVYNGGFQALDSLSPEARAFLPPLPVPYDSALTCYSKLATGMGGHNNPNLPKAQALKDATMAYYLSRDRKEGEKVLHFNGAYHSDNYQGINWYLAYYHAGIKVKTVSVVEQGDIDAFNKEKKGLADFIIVIDSDIPKSY